MPDSAWPKADIVQDSCTDGAWVYWRPDELGSTAAFVYTDYMTPGKCMHVVNDGHINDNAITNDSCGSPFYHDNIWYTPAG